MKKALERQAFIVTGALQINIEQALLPELAGSDSEIHREEREIAHHINASQ